MTLFFLSFMLLSKKSYTNYLAMSLFPLCLTIAKESMSARDLMIYGLFGTTAAVEPSMWFRLLNNQDFSVLWNPSRFADQTVSGVISFLCVELILLGCYANYWHRTFRKLYPRRGVF